MEKLKSKQDSFGYPKIEIEFYPNKWDILHKKIEDFMIKSCMLVVLLTLLILMSVLGNTIWKMLTSMK